MAKTKGAVYTTTNGIERNEIVHYEREEDGTLVPAGWRSTYGRGVGDTTDPEDPLGSQGCLLLSPDNESLIAVNAGSDEVSVIGVADGGGLTRVSVGSSGGSFPASAALSSEGRLYVLNSGGDGLLVAFDLDGEGGFARVPGSERLLRVAGQNPPPFIESPAQVSYDPSGRFLIVTVKKGNFIHVFPLDDQGLPSREPVTTVSEALLPFSFAFSPAGHLLLCEPFGLETDIPAANSGAVSSYRLNDDGSLDKLSGSVVSHQTATCWIVISPFGPFAYCTNNGSATISCYGVGDAGELTLLGHGETGETAHAPLDLALAADGRYLYTVNYVGVVNAFRVEDDGALTAIGQYDAGSGEEGAVGIAAY